MRVLIAGCGYVGAVLARQLADAAHEVYALRRSDTAQLAGVRTIRADLTRRETLAQLPPDLDCIFYTAAPDGPSLEAYRAVYVDGVRNLLDAATAAGARRILLTTSTAVYGQNAGEWVDESSPAEPEAFQGRTLLEAESLIARSRAEAVAVRFGGIYGPGRTRLLEQVRNGTAAIPDRPSYTNRIHRDDCALVLAHLASLARPESVYLGVDDDPADRRELIGWLAERLAAPAPRLELLEGRPVQGKRCRNRRLRASGYRMRYPSFRDGYAAMIRETDSSSRTTS